MDRTTARRARVLSYAAVAAFIAGGLALFLSVCGQLIAARRLATDTNSGHPSADQTSFHVLAVTPSLLLSVLAVLLGVLAAHRPGRSHRFAVLGMLLGVVAAALTFADLPGGLAAQYWIEPLPDER